MQIELVKEKIAMNLEFEGDKIAEVSNGPTCGPKNDIYRSVDEPFWKDEEQQKDENYRRRLYRVYKTQKHYICEKQISKCEGREHMQQDVSVFTNMLDIVKFFGDDECACEIYNQLDLTSYSRHANTFLMITID